VDNLEMNKILIIDDEAGLEVIYEENQEKIS
jgi:hypothetical protein